METTYTAFADHKHLLHTHSDLATLLAAVQANLDRGRTVTIFDDHSGQRTELERQPELEAVRERLSGKRSGPGRPKLGVQSREISLLPRHWDWLNEQHGGASAAIRRLVEVARKCDVGRDQLRAAQEGMHKAMTTLAGDEPGFEEALRRLYARDFAGVRELIQKWPLEPHFARLLTRMEEM
ncbi:hypothetical protein ABS71_19630 [bacterium SCN 62-11]|nr:DUF2239 family protein [Candidatus Eremiobacteraeota bacterium]ODT57593.1 MAG: hypothetical protein ABS71_19630 [bacterium SCN 62-11]